MTGSVKAALLAYEPFTNSAGTAVVGSGGGFGWATNWQQSVATGQGVFTNIALTYTDANGKQLVVAGGSAFFQGLTTANSTQEPYRNFNFIRGSTNITSVNLSGVTNSDGGNTWISFLIVRQGPTGTLAGNPYGRGVNVCHDFTTNVLVNVNEVQKLSVGNGSGAAQNTVALLPAGGNLKFSTNTFGVRTNFVVVKIEHVAGAANFDNAYLFVNPLLAAEPANSEAKTNELAVRDFTFDRLRIFVGGNASVAQPYGEAIIDEYRVGETFADVAPYVTSLSATKLLAILPGQTFSSGVAPSGTPTSQTAGATFNLTLYAVNSDGITVDVGYSGVKTVSYTGPANAPDGSAPIYTTSVTFTNGVSSNAVVTTLVKAETISLTPVIAGLEGLTSSNVTVNAGTTALLQIKSAATGGGSLIPAQNLDSGSALTGYSVSYDSYSNFIANVAATWSLTNKTVGVVNGDLVAAGDNKSATFTGAASGTAQIRADASSLVATSGVISVIPVTAVKMFVTLPGQTFSAVTGNSGSASGQTAGAAFNVTLTAVDANTNIVPTYSGSKTITYSGPGGTPTYTTAVTFTNGVSSNSVVTTLKKAETTTITATDGTLTGVTSSSLTVSPGALNKLQLLVPGEVVAPGTASGKTGSPSSRVVGSAFTVTVNGVDANWNIVSATDNIHITTTDPADTEPANNILASGTRTFSITPATIGSMTITASDVSNGSITSSTSPAINVTSSQAIQREANTSLAMPATPPALSYTFTNAFPGLVFTNPVCIVSPPGETNRLFVLEKRGRIIVITNLAAPTRTVFLDITNIVTAAADTSTSSEQGLLSMAFHPGYATNRYFYVWYTGSTNASATTWLNILARYQVSSNNPNAALTNEQRMISQFDRYNNHNGGDLHFGPTDGYLYLTIGDEGNQQGTNGNPQRIDKNFFSCMLRLDVDKKPGNLEPNPHPAVVTNASGQAYYSVPVDNPFVHTSLGGDWNGMFNDTNFVSSLSTVRTEMWAVGLRNPFRFSFSPLDNTLYLGDVGEQDEEEINLIQRGKNYGWNWYDGTNSRPGYTPAGGLPATFTNTPPLTYYTQIFTADKYSVIGGYVYTGSRMSLMYGAYFFADYGKGNVWAMRNTGTNVTSIQELFIDDFEAGLANISTFGVDPSNLDMLYADLKNGTNGMIKRIVYSTNTPAGTPIPPTLADTGAFSDVTNLVPAPGVVAYDINVPFWSDNAIKTRWISVPNTNLTITFNPDGNYQFPTGTVWIKHFDFELTNGVPASRKRLETRLLVKNSTGVYGVTYRWGNSTTNATLVDEAGYNENLVVNDGGGILRTQAWHYPSRSECLQCHTEMGGYALGFNTPQLNKPYTYSNGVANEISAFSDAGYFNSNVTGVASMRFLAKATNTNYSLEFRARSYFASNCRNCHQGTGIAPWNANIETPLAQAGIIDGALVNYLGDSNNRVIKPGSLANSVIYKRISELDSDHMPPLGTALLDSNNIALIAAWITNGIPGSLSLQTPSTLSVGGTAQATLLANNASVTNNVTTDPETSFTSLNPSVVTVTAAGLLSAVSSSGTAQIVGNFGVLSVTNTVTVCDPPMIVANPYQTAAAVGQSVSLSVVASGSSLSYAWYRSGTGQLSNGTTAGGSVVSGSTTATLSISTLSTNDNGNYYCVVSNGCTAVTSQVASVAAVVSATTTGLFPAGKEITRGNLAVRLTDFATAPYSARTTSTYPPAMNFAGQLSRINFMRSEPTNAPGYGSRFFVCDNNRNLYIVPKTNPTSSNTWVKYINLEEVFPKFDNDPGYAGGLTTFAFDPEYATNGLFYTVHMETTGAAAAPTNGALPGFNTNGYTTTTEIDPPVGTVVRVAVLVEWKDTNVVNTTFEGTAREILRVGFTGTIHPMGDLLFNPLARPGDADYRNLYIANGDGGAGEATDGRRFLPKRLDTLVGKILRITPDINLRTNDLLITNGVTATYRVPTTGSDPNPFVADNGTFTNFTGCRKEIFASGFRNCHRISWDMQSNQLIEDEIGLNSYEEVNLIHKGLNYGYAEREGVEAMTNGITGSQQGMLFPTNNDFLTVTGITAPFTPRYPAVCYSSREGDAVSSGFVYRGTAMPQLVGKYVFGDITTARLFYCDFAEMLAADDTNRLTLATIRELQPLYDSPFDSPDVGTVKRRLFDVVADSYTNRGGFVSGQRLPGSAANTATNDIEGVAYGKGRADIRIAVGDDNELYILSKSDGIIRKMVASDNLPVGGTNTFLRAPGATLSIAISTLLANCSDADNDTLSVTAVSASTNGVTPGNSGGYLTYSNSNFVNDRFTFTVSDGNIGGVATGTVVILNDTLASLTLQTPASIVAGNTAQATLLANYSTATNDVTSDAQTSYQSSNPAIITVNASGLLTAVASSGSASIIASFGGISVTNTVAATCAVPVITVDPAGQGGVVSQGATFSVTATGTATLVYSWYKTGNVSALTNGPTAGGSVISGATTASLSVSGLTTNDAGSYYCVVSNSCGTDASSSALLTVSAVSTVTGLFPSSQQVAKSGLAVVLTNYAMSPYSARTTGTYPPAMNFPYNGQLSRINFMRAEPTNAPGFGSRLWVCDNNRNIYLVNKANPMATNNWVQYINFEEVFPKFDNDPGYAGGLTTFAFDPEYASNGIFYTAHMETTGTAVAPTNGALPGFNTNGYTTTTEIDPPTGTIARVAVLVEWKDSNVTNSTFEGTAREILRVGFTGTIHPMGDLLFNPLAKPGDADYRNLYVANGDGGAGEQTDSRHYLPQRLDTLVGKILRITPDITLRTNDELVASGRYRIPTTGVDPNPFVTNTASFTNFTGVRKEIFAYGFRNCHRISWDEASNQLIENDIGLQSYEEVNIIHKGLNYGYAEREGVEIPYMTNAAKQVGSQLGIPFPTNSDFLTVTGMVSAVSPRYPAACYSSRDGDAVSSGFVYRGTAMPQLVGKYIFGDITTARIFYCDYAEMLAADDTNRLTLATIRELQVLHDSPIDSPDLGVIKCRLFDVIADTYTNRGGFTSGQRLPGSSTAATGNDSEGVPYGKGRADIRFAVGDDHELYIISKSDGMIRKMVASDNLPVGGTNTFIRGTNTRLKIKISTLLAGATDADNDAVTFSGVNASTNGVTPTFDGTYIYYTNVNNVNDRFTYNLSDGHPGGNGTGLVIVQISPLTATNTMLVFAPGMPGLNSNTITMSGIPGYEYGLQYSTNLKTSPWFTLGITNAGTNGIWSLIDSGATNTERYYRAVAP